MTAKNTATIIPSVKNKRVIAAGLRGPKGENSNGILSINGYTDGVVVLDAEDVGADVAGAAEASVQDHETAADPHGQYMLETAGEFRLVAGTHIAIDRTNPLAPVISSSGGGGASPVDSVNGQTGVVVLDTDDVAQGTTNLYYPQADKDKLAGIASGATANSSDATLLDRANHTGTQAVSTVSGLQDALDDKEFVLTAGSNITIDRTIPSAPVINAVNAGDPFAGFRWNNSTLTGSPGSGKVGINTALPADATIVYISTTTNDGVDATPALVALKQNDVVFIREKADALNWVRYRVTGSITTQSGYVEIPVVVVTGSGSEPGNNTGVLVALTYSGEQVSPFSTTITESTVSRILSAGDAGKYIRFTNSSASSVTIPPQADAAWLADTEIHIRRAANANLTLTAGIGVILNPPSGGTLVMSDRMGVTIKRVAENAWDVIGQTVAV